MQKPDVGGCGDRPLRTPEATAPPIAWHAPCTAWWIMAATANVMERRHAVEERPS
jgi:hypothetical protein